jgi:hypothetical protein
MKSKIAILSSFVCLLFSGSVFSASSFGGATVTGLNVDSGSGNVLFVKVDQPAGTGGCHTDTSWNFAISLDPTVNPAGKYIFTLLMSAQSSGAKVDIFGLTTCLGYPTIQGIQRVSLSS